MPDLKTVALTGTAAAREITERYELFPNRNNELAAHVIVATYQAAEKASAMLNRIGRWEAIIVDEGQRLKSGDKGQLFRVLTSLRAGNRVLMSGTPLNNNLRERKSTGQSVQPAIDLARRSSLQPPQLHRPRELP